MTITPATQSFHKYNFDSTHEILESIILELLIDSGAFGDPPIDNASSLVHFSPFPPMPIEDNFYSLFPRTTIPDFNEGHIGWFFVANPSIEGFMNNTAKMNIEIELHGCAAIGRPNIASTNQLEDYSQGFHESRRYILNTTRNVIKRIQDTNTKFKVFNRLQGLGFAPYNAQSEYSWENLTYMWFYQSRTTLTLQLDLQSLYSL